MPGYVSSVGGYLKPPSKQKTSLALAASTRTPASSSNPFGLTGGSGGILGSNDQAHFQIPRATPVAPAQPAPSPSATPRVSPQVVVQAQTPIPQHGLYDINTDPALQQTIAFTNLSDEQAKAAAEMQRRDIILASGFSDLAGGDSGLAAAAAANPTSTRAQLGQQRDRNLKQLTDALNSNNLIYSGYRVTQEQQQAQDYQNALAQAAAQVNAALGGIDSNLAAALNANL
jgi:hypothetical protein